MSESTKYIFFFALVGYILYTWRKFSSGNNKTETNKSNDVDPNMTKPHTEKESPKNTPPSPPSPPEPKKPNEESPSDVQQPGIENLNSRPRTQEEEKLFNVDDVFSRKHDNASDQNAITAYTKNKQNTNVLWNVRQFSPKTSQSVQSVPPSSGIVESLQMNKDNTLLYALTSLGELYELNISTSTINNLHGKIDGVSSPVGLKFTPVEETGWLLFADGTKKIYQFKLDNNIKTATPVTRTFPIGNAKFNDFAFTSDMKRVFIGTTTGELLMYDVPNGKIAHLCTIPDKTPINRVEISEKSNTVYFANTSVYKYDLTTHKFEIVVQHADNITGLYVTLLGEIYFGGSKKLYKIVTNQDQTNAIVELQAFETDPHGITFDNNGAYVGLFSNITLSS